MTGTARPNVLVFFTDQQRHDSTGLHGNPLDLTPNLDALGRRGTHLSHSFTCQPVCGPARACLQTGQYAAANGCFRNGIPLPTDRPALGGMFREAGYETACIGKWHLAGDEHRGAVPEKLRGGYEHWLASNILEFTSDSYHTTLWDNENRPVNLPGYRVDAVTDAAIRWLDRPRQRPFFLFLSHIEPHHQNHQDDYPPPEGYRQRYSGRWVPPDLAALGGSAHQHLGGYWGMVKRLDEALGRVLDALRSLDLFENTVVLFSSDHACHFKTRNNEYKRSCHDSSIRVPTVLHGGPFTGGGQVQQLVSLVDLPPTLLDAAEIAVPSHMQGRSILPLLRGGRGDWPEEAFVQISESQVARAIRTRRWKYSVHAPDKSGWRDSASDRYVEQYLYDLEADPHELTNLAGMESFAEVSADLRARLVKRMVEAGEKSPVIDPAPAIKGGQRRP